MKRLLSLAAFFLSVLAAPYSDSTLAEWDEYKAAYDKFYETPEEDTRRLETYLATKRKVEQHNSKYQRGETTFTMAINKFADWFPEELDRLYGLRVDRSRRGGRIYKRQPGAVAPDSINWVDQGAVTSVKEQGNCSSGYAFSAAGALEGLMFRTNNTVTSLSVQELIDCTREDNGCYGGDPMDCLWDITYLGEEAETTYSYEAKKGECRGDKDKAVVYCTGVRTFFPGDEESMHDAVALVGPVSIGMAIKDDFVFYSGGVFDGSCGYTPNHALLAVGYDTDKETGKDYWLVKNSWGTNWGEKGYVKVRRNINKCGIAEGVSFPIFEKMAD